MRACACAPRSWGEGGRTHACVRNETMKLTRGRGGGLLLPSFQEKPAAARTRHTTTDEQPAGPSCVCVPLICFVFVFAFGKKKQGGGEFELLGNRTCFIFFSPPPPPPLPFFSISRYLHHYYIRCFLSQPNGMRAVAAGLPSRAHVLLLVACHTSTWTYNKPHLLVQQRRQESRCRWVSNGQPFVRPGLQGGDEVVGVRGHQVALVRVWRCGWMRRQGC
jgi:hypothetical protein